MSYYIIRMANEDGSPGDFVLKTLSVSLDEAWEKYLVKEIDEDMKRRNLTPSKPFPIYYEKRKSLELYGFRAVHVKIEEVK